MKNLLSAIGIILILILTGCSTTRKTTQTSTSEQITSQTTTTSDTNTENKEAINTRLNLNETLTAEIDFIRYEYSDGTIVDEVYPETDSDITTPRNREQTEPPNPGKGIKSVTVGHINLNKASEQNEETNTTNDTKKTTSLTSQNDTTSNSTQEAKITEKPKRGHIYSLGAITASVIALTILGFLIRWLIRKKRSQQ